MKRVEVMPIGKILEAYFVEMGLDGKLDEQRIIDAMPEVLGSYMSRYIDRIYIKGETLYLHVSNSVLKGELNMSHLSLRDKLNAAVSADKMIIKDVIIK